MKKDTVKKNGKHTDISNRLVYLTFLQQEDEVRHHSYDEELLQYELLREGDLRSVEETRKIFQSNRTGKLSDDPVRDKQYLFVASATLATRFAIEGGMEAIEAYNLSDLYIQKVDQCQSVSEIYDLQIEMIRDFTERVAAARQKRKTGRPSSAGETELDPAVYRAMDYIYYHLHEKITLEDVARAVGMSKNYLNTLFQKERGMTITVYIRKRRIEAAENMLVHSEYTLAEIAAFLAFSSESHFIQVFREETGMTPLEYRKREFRHHRRWRDRLSLTDFG